jgi:hypothetical protein
MNKHPVAVNATTLKAGHVFKLSIQRVRLVPLEQRNVTNPLSGFSQNTCTGRLTVRQQ